MTKPSELILSTDFPNLKNDDRFGGTITVSGGIIIPGNSYVQGYGDAKAGKIGSLVRGRISSSKQTDSSGNPVSYTGQGISFNRTGTMMGFSVPYAVTCFMYRVSPTDVRIQVYIANPYSDTLTGASGDETITFQVNTYIAPYA